MIELPKIYDTAKALDRQEVRCPACGKLLLKGKFAPGTELLLQCRGTKCVFHRKPLTMNFMNPTTLTKSLTKKTNIKERSVKYV